MFDKLFPRRIDNAYHGHKAALWIFGLVVALKITQSVGVISSGHSIARDADGIPLEAYTADAAKTAVALFAQGSLWRLTFGLLCALVLLRYRSAIPMMFALLVLNYLAGELVFQFAPLIRMGTPPGPIVNLIAFVLMVIGLVLSLWGRSARTQSDVGQQ
jgi:hypothetical protein